MSFPKRYDRKIINRAIELASQELPYDEIAVKMNGEGFTAANGTPLSYKTVSNILIRNGYRKRETSKGKRKYTKRPPVAATPAKTERDRVHAAITLLETKSLPEGDRIDYALMILKGT